MDVLIIILVAWLPLSVAAGLVIGRALSHIDTTTPAPPIPPPAPAPPPAFACFIYTCTGRFVCPGCTNTLAALEQDVTA